MIIPQIRLKRVSINDCYFTCFTVIASIACTIIMLAGYSWSAPPLASKAVAKPSGELSKPTIETDDTYQISKRFRMVKSLLKMHEASIPLISL